MHVCVCMYLMYACVCVLCMCMCVGIRGQLSGGMHGWVSKGVGIHGWGSSFTSSSYFLRQSLSKPGAR